MRLPVVIPGLASLACILVACPAPGQAENAFAERGFALGDLQQLNLERVTGLLLPPAFGQDEQVRAPMLIANEMRPDSRDRLAVPLNPSVGRPETRDRLARPVGEVAAYRQRTGERPESRDPLARPFEEVRAVRPELFEADPRPNAAAQRNVPTVTVENEGFPVAPVALSAVPTTAQNTAPALQRTTRGQAEGLGLAQYLSAPWQQAAFIAGLVLLASLLFWRLGMRARNGDAHAAHGASAARRGPRIDGPPAEGRYETLQEAIAAMKASVAARA